jgi:outer membrane murein-binding lipoprotein Lpp
MSKRKLSALVLAALAAVVIGGCRSQPLRTTPTTNLPQAAESTGTAAAAVSEAANSIGEANAEIQAAVPDVAKQTDQIAAGVEELRTVEEQLRANKITIAAEAKAAKANADELFKAKSKIVQLEDRSNGILNNIMIGTSVAGMALAVVSGVWLRSWKGVVTGLAIVAVCAVGMWIIKYRAIIAIVGAICAAAYATYCIITERKVTTDLVRTVEVIKPSVPNFKDQANAVQTRAWVRKRVDAIKGTFKP